MAEENKLITQRKDKLQKILKAKINPYPYQFEKTADAAFLLQQFAHLKEGEKSKETFCIAGRLMTFRIMGKASFGHIQDSSGQIQIFLRENELGKTYALFTDALDLGDIIGIEGKIFRTKKGELSIWTEQLTLLCKSLRPLPEKWHGLKDIEIRYRQRYLDLIANPEVKKIFSARTAIIHAMRDFLTSKGFLEVDTPVLQSIYGGTNARPFKTFLNELKMDVYLRISNELYLKRLIVGGFEKIFEFSKDFRNESIDRTHNPEFLMMETMWAYADYKNNMDLTEEMIEHIAKKILGTTRINYQGTIIDVQRPWQRLTVLEALKKYAGIDVGKMTEKQLKEMLKKHHVELAGEFSRGNAIAALFEELVEEKLIQPTLVYDFPSATCVLAKKRLDNPEFAERFEPYINGWEIGNSYTEENQPDILRAAWQQEEGRRKKGDEEAQRMDEDFIHALEIGMPPTSGLGIGVDRLVMLLTNQPSIRDVLFFPFMKR